MAVRGEILSAPAERTGPVEWLRRRPMFLALGGLGALALSLALGVAFGSVAVPPAETAGILARRLMGLPITATWPPAAETIVMELRLPRVLTAMLVGSGLAVAG